MALTTANRASPSRRSSAARLLRRRGSHWAALVATALLVAGSTLLVALLTPHVPAESAGVVYLVAVLGVSSLYGLGWGLGASLASALAFNFFFLPPEHTLVINASADWAALGAFAVTAVVTSQLAARARQDRDEAARREAEARLSASFATLIADAPALADVLPALGAQAARALGAADGTVVRGAAESTRASSLPLEFNGRRMGELRLIEPPPGALESPAAGRIADSLAGLIALGEERERRLHQQVQAEALNRSNDLKTAILRAVSHDLRSPLQAITTAAGGLRYAELDPDERELVETIADQGERMARMIEKLLDLSRLQAGAATPRMDWLDVRELVEAAVDAAAGRPRRSRVHVHFEGDLPLLRGDGPQLQRVIANLVENALKFSPPDAAVDVRVERAGRRLLVSVRDRGPGVPAEEAERIFEPFHRAASRPDAPGSGLGLAIARGLARANGGTLELDADAGPGSRFVLSLPTAPSRPPR
jgi:two-component system, OmpR family, sensor histidine kinase KdpD